MRVNLESVPPVVQDFIRALPQETAGIELAFGDRVVWRLVPPKLASEDERLALLSRGKALLQAARDRNKAAPGQVVEREIRDAVKIARGER